MSVSLIVLRLELADDAQITPNINYTAPHFTLPTEEKSYADAVEKTPPLKSVLQTHKGRREYQPISVETFINQVNMDEASDLTTLEKWNTSSNEEMRSVMKPEVIARSKESSPKLEKECKNPGSQESLNTKSKSQQQGSVKLRDEKGACSSSRPGSGKSKSKGSGSISTIHFFSGNPAVENTEGIIHLYKNNQLTSLTEDVPRSEMVCMLTVPASMTSQDLLLFVTPVEPYVENIKIIRDSTPNQYMVLLKFRSQKYADEFYKNFNGIQYNSFEADVCHLAYVAKVETMKASEGASLPVCGLTELPVCPVCLERMDESVNGVLTVLCNHSFHGSCLAQWGDTSCPVCRYMQTPKPVPDNKCFHCDATHNLWICLICGHVGCGRYEGGHASSHFQETNHTYSMHLENNRVWDYAGDNFVHRLVQNKGDGKLVEVDELGNRMEDDEKLDSITLEYTYLLTSQLEAQRHHFQEKIQRIEKESLARIDEVETRAKKALEACTKLEHQLTVTQKEKQSLEKKCSQLSSKLQKITLALTEEQEMNKALRQNQAQWQSRVSEMEKTLQQREKEFQDVQEQLRDVMFYFEAQQKLSETTEATQDEIKESHIVVQSGATGGSGGLKRGRKKGGRQ